VFGLRFINPIGVGAGLTKNGTAFEAWTDLGFGFVEIGTVTPRPQRENEGRNLFRLVSDHAIINRLGFPSAGAARVLQYLQSRTDYSFPVGLNIGKNRQTSNERAVNDYLECLRSLYTVSDYFVVNVSSPNTPGLRALQDKSALEDLMSTVCLERDALAKAHRRRVPILLKIAPDLSSSAINDIVDVVRNLKIDGIIATNTTVTRGNLSSPQASAEGGLSGRPLFPLALDIVRTLSTVTNKQVPIVGVGGIFSGEDAYDMIKAGASLVQIHTGLVYRGPGMVKKIKQELIELLERDGFASVSQAVGISANAPSQRTGSASIPRVVVRTLS
jgi:dihydroorotate dehydrogenase